MLMNREATLDDLYLVEGRAEIVNGRIVMLDQGGFAHSRAAMYIVGCLQQFEKRTRSGYAMNELANYACQAHVPAIALSGWIVLYRIAGGR